MITILAGAFLATTGQLPAVIVNKSGVTTTIKFENGLVARRTTAKVSGAKLFTMPGSNARIAAWSEAGRNGAETPYYAISLDGSKVERSTATNYDVELQYGKFDPTRSTLSVPANLAAGSENEVYIVQFVSQPLQEMRDAVESAGGEIYHYMTNHSYLVRLNADEKANVGALPFVRAVVPYHPAYRTDAGLRAKIASNSLPSQHLYNIQLLDEKQSTMDTVVNAIALAGGEITRSIPANAFLTARLTPDQFVQLLHMNEVSFADLWSPPSQDMTVLRTLHGVDYVNTFGNFTGAGFRGAVMDGGFVTNHVAWATRPPIPQGAIVVNNHGTACYGINFGDGTGNGAGIGVLPQATGVIAVYTGYLSGAGDRNALTADLITKEAAYQSNSWGDAQVTTYTTISAQMDSILFNNDVVILQSQSNLGTQSSRPQAWAKNIVSVGGINHFNNTNWDDDRWNSGASVGPAADGRIKPDLSNAYDGGTTTYTTTTTGYATFSGTSQATPITSGLFGVMYNIWGQGFFGNTCLGSNVFQNRPKASLAKAIMVNTARMYDVAVNVDTTRVRQGWGTASLQNLWDRRNNMFIVNETDALTNLQTKTYKLYVPAGTPLLKATMVYLDPAGTVGAAQTRKNNLSLRVTSPGGATTYWGNNGMGSTSNFSTSGGTENSVDTVECVNVANPASGTWTVEVIGSDINTDARTETPAVVDADFGLVVSGVQYSLAPSSFTAQNGTLVSGGLNELARSDNTVIVQQESTDAEEIDASRWLVARATAPVANLSQWGFVIEGRTGIAFGRVRVEGWNYTTNTWEFINDTAAAGSDVAVNFATTTSPSRFVHPTTREMQLRLKYRDTDTASESSWMSRTDHVRFHVNPL